MLKEKMLNESSLSANKKKSQHVTNELSNSHQQSNHSLMNASDFHAISFSQFLTPTLKPIQMIHNKNVIQCAKIGGLKYIKLYINSRLHLINSNQDYLIHAPERPGNLVYFDTDVLDKLVGICKILAELAFKLIPPNKYYLNEDDNTFYSREDDSRKSTLSDFYNSAKDKFDAKIISNVDMINLLKDHLLSYSLYKQENEFTQQQMDIMGSEYKFTTTLGPNEEFMSIKNDVQKAVSEGKMELTNSLLNKHNLNSDTLEKSPFLSGHMGNLSQAMEYTGGDYIIKYIMDPDKQSLMYSKDFLALDPNLTSTNLRDSDYETPSRGEGSVAGYIGTKRETSGEGTNFSFAIGKSKWSAILFLSLVEDVEGFYVGTV